MADLERKSFYATQGPPISDDVNPLEHDCLVCQTIADAVAHWHARKYNIISLGNWDEFIARVKCKTCQQIVHYFAGETETPPMSASCSLVLEYVTSNFWISCKYSPLGPSPKPEEDHDHKVLKLVPPAILTSDCLHYIPVDSQVIDITQFQHWLAKCEINHGGECDKQLELHTAGTTSSLTLIDIQQSCLVITTSPVKYVALSYVWGITSETLMATTYNTNYLSTPGSLEAPETKSRIPRTILDAIFVTKMTGIRYIWIDRLCIVQDDSHHFNEQLQQMASIYSKASFAIIAADGRDANHGLRGVGGEALPRLYNQIYYNFSSEARLLQWPETESFSNPPSWYTRAWTFQERAVSRRTLVFVKGTVYWRCRSATFREELRAAPNSAIGPTNVELELKGWPFYALTQNPWPDLNQYFSLVGGYNQRNLSFETDALRAFTAIINAFSHSFRGGFLFGVPEFLFDVGLLWSGYEPLRRRKGFPSWSWVGWSGDISFTIKEAWEPEAESAFYDIKVSPVIDWAKMRNGDHAHIKIDNSYHIYQGMAYDSDPTIPQGWAWDREKRGFFHPSIPGNSFSYPFPIPANLTPPDPDNWSPLLPFRAEICTMFLGSSLRKDENKLPNFQTCLHIELNDRDGMRVGVIESMFTSKDEYVQGGKCELIAISRSFYRRNRSRFIVDGEQLFEEMDIFSELKDEDLYRIYNVLWIEWEGGIAYRKALGRVMKDAWEKQDLKIADILLG